MASQYCTRCKHRFQVLDDEVGMHDCPHCGWDGRTADEMEPKTCTACGDNEATDDDGYCDECRDDIRQSDRAAHEEHAYPEDEDWQIDGVGFADPGGRSALRAATPDNPRIYPCPTCKAPNRLTRLDVARGYQCDTCADRLERGEDLY